MARSSRSSSSGGLAQDTVYIGGSFDVVNNQAHNALARTNANTGAVDPVVFSRNGVPGSSRAGSSRSPSRATTSPLRRHRPGPPRRHERRQQVRRYDPDSGANVWEQNGPDGDAQAIELINGTLYGGFHGGWNGDTSKRLEGLSPANGRPPASPPTAAGSSACAGWRRTAAGCSPSATSAPWGAPASSTAWPSSTDGGRERDTEDIEAAGGDRRARWSRPRGRGVRSPQGHAAGQAHPRRGASTTTLFTTPPHLYRETPLNGWSHDGTAYSVDIASNIVFVGGDFDEARKGNQSAPRSNVMAVERTSGNLLPFVANTNGLVRAVISDGFNTYIGGDFTTVNGVQRPRLAKVNAGTGALDTSFAPSVPVSVTDLLLVGNKLYVVGSFGQVNGVQRRGAALLDKGTGALNPTFAPNAQSRVNTVAINPAGTRLYLGLAGQTGPYLLDVNPVTGATQGRTSRCSTTTSVTSRWDRTARSTWRLAVG